MIFQNPSTLAPLKDNRRTQANQAQNSSGGIFPYSVGQTGKPTPEEKKTMRYLIIILTLASLLGLMACSYTENPIRPAGGPVTTISSGDDAGTGHSHG